MLGACIVHDTDEKCTRNTGRRTWKIRVQPTVSVSETSKLHCVLSSLDQCIEALNHCSVCSMNVFMRFSNLIQTYLELLYPQRVIKLFRTSELRTSSFYSFPSYVC
jgi:hypothetical protein